MAGRFFFRNPQSLLTLALSLCIFAPGICQSGCLPKGAELGEPLKLDCSVPCSGQDNDFEWSMGDEVLETNYARIYFVTVSEDTIGKFGGKTYSCRCQTNNVTKCFHICGTKIIVNTAYVKGVPETKNDGIPFYSFSLVRPKVSLTFTSNPVISNCSNVNVTCTAVSYPKPNIHTGYVIEHPIDFAVNHEYNTTDLDGIIDEIDSAKDKDDGEYKCHVTINCMGESMMSKIVKSLTVKNNTNDTCTNTTMPTTAPTDDTPTTAPTDDTPTTAPTDDTPTTLSPSYSGSATSSFSNFIIMMGITLYVVITSVQV